MIRHYEASGLIRASRHTTANYRACSDNDVYVLRFVKRARGLGFSTADINTLLNLWQNKSRSSSAVKRIAGTPIAELERRIAQQHLARHCHGDHRPECPILDELGK